ncbi:Uma2 family endonuclease [Cystobacter fuscus]
MPSVMGIAAREAGGCWTSRNCIWAGRCWCQTGGLAPGARPWTAGGEEPFFDLAPDWVCEVLSPSTAALDRGRKLALYHQEGVSHAWLMDPRAHTLEVYRRGEKSWRLVSHSRGEETVRAEPFDAEPLELGLLWAPKSTPAPGP